MNDPRLDRDLQELFGELRTEDTAKTPDFAEMMTRVRAQLGEGEGAGAPEVVSIHSKRVGRSRAGARGVPRARWGWLGGVLAAAVVAGVMLVDRGPISDEAFEELVGAYASDPALGGWRSQTDALLELPGREIVTTVPRVGGARTLLGVPGLN